MLYYSIFSGWWKEMNTDSLKHLETVQNSIYECLHVQWQSGTSSLNEWLPGPFRSLWRSKEQKDQAVWRPPRPGPFDATASIVMRTFWAAPLPRRKQKSRAPNRYRMNSDDFKTACNLQAAPWRHCYQPLIPRRSKRRTCSWPCSWEGPTVSPCFSFNFWKTWCWKVWWTWWKLDFWLSFAHQWHVKCQLCQFVTVFLGWWYVNMCVPHRWYRLCARGWG